MAKLKRPRFPYKPAVEAFCKSCVYDELALGTWRHQTAACRVTHCALWGGRPVHDRAPSWILAHDVAQLPPEWWGLSHEEVVRLMKREHEGDEADWGGEEDDETIVPF